MYMEVRKFLIGKGKGEVITEFAKCLLYFKHFTDIIFLYPMDVEETFVSPTDKVRNKLREFNSLA